MKIGRKEVGLDKPTYFIADIASNHDSSLDRAKRLIFLAAEAGADAVKFQNFKAETIVSDYGFKQLGGISHQSHWKDSVYETYKRCETPLSWTPELAEAADKAGVDYLTTPYDIDMLPDLAPYTSAWKLGSGDITWEKMVRAMCAYDKPLIISTGSSTEDDICRVMEWTDDRDVVLMQCNTNYTGDLSNFEYVNLKVLVQWWGSGIVLGLSDHTPGHAAVLGAVALAAKVIEKHFTDDNLREGPDHAFSMTPVDWGTMVSRVRELELALGDGVKKVEENERETVVLQRRSIRAIRDIPSGTVLGEEDLICLRPCPLDALPPYRIGELIGKKAPRDIERGDYIGTVDILRIPLNSK
jgi:N-acetylneuraminate synthase